MIKNISFGHYKAFEQGEIEIRPLTFLLGANSVGKSSILQLILSLQQTALCDASYRSALKLNGGYVTLGENINLFRKKEITTPLNIKITFENEGAARPDYGLSLGQKPNALNKSRIRGAEKASILR